MSVTQAIIVHFKLEHSIDIWELELHAVLATYGKDCDKAELTEAMGEAAKAFTGLPATAPPHQERKHPTTRHKR